jgi:DNA-directed RNA polymerase specialized sigma24 family protein
MALRCLNDADKQKNADNFETDLLKADLKIKHAPLPVITQNNRIEDSVIPERYRHVATLSRHGLDHSEISAILRISVEEADQLIKLSRLTGRQIQ